MCFPPFCKPAKHFLGCYGLRTGAVVVILLDALYGVLLLVTNSLIMTDVTEPPKAEEGSMDDRRLQGDWILPPEAWILGQHSEFGAHARKLFEADSKVHITRRLSKPTGESSPVEAEEAHGSMPPATPMLGDTSGGEDGAAAVAGASGLPGGKEGPPSGSLESAQKESSEESGEEEVAPGFDFQPHEGWFLQMLDFDIGWGHRLLGFSDHVNLVSGLIYGCVIIFVCAGFLFAIVMYSGEKETNGPLPHATRWFVFFLNLQVFFYALLVFCKLPKLCYIDKHYYPSLDFDCGFLRYLLLEHAVLIISFSSFCIWIFSSYAYILTFGDASKADRPDFTHQLEAMLNIEDIHAAEHAMGLESYIRPYEQEMEGRMARMDGYLHSGLQPSTVSPYGGVQSMAAAPVVPLSQASTVPGAYQPIASMRQPARTSIGGAAASRHSISAHPALGSAYTAGTQRNAAGYTSMR